MKKKHRHLAKLIMKKLKTGKAQLTDLSPEEFEIIEEYYGDAWKKLRV